jgi:hypothetical protein
VDEFCRTVEVVILPIVEGQAILAEDFCRVRMAKKSRIIPARKKKPPKQRGTKAKISCSGAEDIIPP